MKESSDSSQKVKGLTSHADSPLPETFALRSSSDHLIFFHAFNKIYFVNNFFNGFLSAANLLLSSHPALNLNTFQHNVFYVFLRASAP
ncbi:MAG: hypothetical protein HOP08_20605 [Cyclobacteriaceae bacterium]|nr:hypothetical protein [Cyclobacteriaceae bacterium]